MFCILHRSFGPVLWTRILCISFFYLPCVYHTDMGVERSVRLEGLSEAQILKALEDLGKVGASLKA